MNVFRLLLLMVGLALPVMAADDVASKLANASEAQRDKAEAILENQQKRLGICNNLKVVQPVQVVAPGEIEFAKDGSVQGGVWLVRYAVKACGVDGMRTIGFEAHGGRIGMEALVPGASLTDRDLQRDVRRSFAIAAAKVDPTCGQLPVVRSTQVVYPPDPKTKVWREAWVAAACGREIGELIEFTPTDTGTRFVMSLPKHK